MATLIAGGAAYTWSELLGGGRPVPRVDIEGLAPRTEPDRSAGGEEAPADAAPAAPAVVNVLVAGSDARDGLTEQERRELSLGSFDGARADTIMIAQVRTDGSDVALLSIPRDLQVERCDGSSGRINGAFAVAQRTGREGGSCLVTTVTRFTGIPIHHYVEVDVVGFMGVVDTIGGVEMCFDRPLRDHRAGLNVPAGCQRLDGGTALSFVRARSLDPSGDFGRMERQQQFLRAVADEVSDAGFLVNLPRLARVVDQVENAVTTDEGLGLGMLRTLAAAFGDADSGDMVTATVPGDSRNVGGASMVVLREGEAEELFAAFREGRGREHLRRAESAGAAG